MKDNHIKDNHIKDTKEDNTNKADPEGPLRPVTQADTRNNNIRRNLYYPMTFNKY